MFPLSNPISHVSSAAFAQARLKPGSTSVQVLLKPAQLTRLLEIIDFERDKAQWTAHR